jgi:hypothetical protein
MSSNLLLHSSGESGWKRINTAVPAGDWGTRCNIREEVRK